MSDEITTARTNAMTGELTAAANEAVGPSGRAGNAWQHGMYARRIAVGDEQTEAFETLRAALGEQYRPRSVTAWMLVDRLARLQWKLMRAEESELHMIRYAQTSYRSFHDNNYGQRPRELPVDEAVASDLKDDRSGLAKLQLFQMRLERSIHRTIGLLRVLRKSHGGQGKGRTAAARGK